MQKYIIYCKERFDDKHSKGKNYQKVRDHCQYPGEYRSPAHSICTLKYSIPKEITKIFPKRSSYTYHMIIKELVEEF